MHFRMLQLRRGGGITPTEAPCRQDASARALVFIWRCLCKGEPAVPGARLRALCGATGDIARRTCARGGDLRRRAPGGRSMAPAAGRRPGAAFSYPLCAACEAEGRLVPAMVVDHVTPHRGDLRLFWDSGNWQALCKPCHDRKTAAEDRLWQCAPGSRRACAAGEGGQIPATVRF